MSRVTWDRDAEADLDDIWAAIAKDNAGAADRFIDTLGEKCRLLATHSEMGQLRPELAPNLLFAASSSAITLSSIDPPRTASRLPG